MRNFQKMIAEIDQQLEDIETAKAAAAAQGKGPGDYDLSVLAGAVKKDRLAAEAKKLENDMKAFNPQPGPMLAEVGNGSASVPMKEEKVVSDTSYAKTVPLMGDALDEKIIKEEGVKEDSESKGNIYRETRKASTGQGDVTDVTLGNAKIRPARVIGFAGDTDPNIYKHTPFAKAGVTQNDFITNRDYNQRINDYLFTKKPEAKIYFDKVIAEKDPEKKKQLLDEAAKKGYFVSQDDIKKHVFSDDEYKAYVANKYKMDKANYAIYGISTRGSKEMSKTLDTFIPDNHGLRNAIKYGLPENLEAEDVSKSEEYYLKNKKDLEESTSQ